MKSDSCFHLFTPQPDRADRPEKFTFPFFYSPHPWSTRAADLLIETIESESFAHDFGLHETSVETACGKMFGVLVVENTKGELGYLAAFSGKLGNRNKHEGFVPPVFDMLDPNGYYRKNEDELSAMNRQIEALENDPKLLSLQVELNQIKIQSEQARSEAKNNYREGKHTRERIRKTLDTLPAQEAAKMADALNQQSRQQQMAYKQTTKFWKAVIEKLEHQISGLLLPAERLKTIRRSRSAALQAWLFEQYTFLNSRLESTPLGAIFHPIDPPSGAGECAAPKLLHYAFSMGYAPICMAEFWWGKSPSTEIRKHRNFYPACRGKCLPILTYMLQGIETDPNPLLDEQFDALQLEILAEDDALLIIHKPSGLLSVPGKTGQDSVYTQIKRLRPEANGPLIVHRLDRSTSGIMLIPKTERAYYVLQQQFIERSIEKRYVAVLDGIITEKSGEISLPLRPDIDDRPRQLVCYEHGREAITKWEKVEEKDGCTRVYFYPKTGRTHQLRVHAAHPNGLNAAICGDELYGKSAERLKLHAASIVFQHPITGERVRHTHEPEF